MRKVIIRHLGDEIWHRLNGRLGNYLPSTTFYPRDRETEHSVLYTSLSKVRYAPPNN